MYFWGYFGKQLWNNKFSYEFRKYLWSECKLYIPDIKDVKNINKNNLYKNLKIWKEIVFEEIMNWKLCSMKWLEKYLIGNFNKWKVCIFDNHNLAFYFIGNYFLESWKKLDVIHIDQHSDMKEPSYIPDKLTSNKVLEEYTFSWLNVWNYLIPLQKLNFIKNIYQYRTEYSILNMDTLNIENNILNIDLDFWEENMSSTKKSLEKVKKLIEKSPLTLIATSPYFIDQKKALKLIHKLFYLK